MHGQHAGLLWRHPCQSADQSAPLRELRHALSAQCHLQRRDLYLCQVRLFHRRLAMLPRCRRRDLFVRELGERFFRSRKRLYGRHYLHPAEGQVRRAQLPGLLPARLDLRSPHGHPFAVAARQPTSPGTIRPGSSSGQRCHAGRNPRRARPSGHQQRHRRPRRRTEHQSRRIERR